MNEIEQILKKFNLNGPFDGDIYINKMGKFKEGKMFLDFIDERDMYEYGNFDYKKLYNIMSKNIAVSELVTSHNNTPIYKEMLVWFDKQNYSPNSFIELGCNNGMFAFTLSQLWKDVKISGIDYSLHAIKSAKKLASKYKINNCTFFHQNINNSFVNIPKVDLIIAPFFFHEIIDWQDCNWNIINDNLNMLTNKNTKLIAINRFPDSNTQCEQLKLNLKDSDFIETKRDTIKVFSALKDWDTESFPIQVFSMNPSH